MVIKVFRCSLRIALFASVVSLQAMRVWQKGATTLSSWSCGPWSQCQTWIRCQRMVFQKVNSFAIDQCLEILRKAKYFTSHQRKLICRFEPSVEMSYTWAGPQPEVSLQRAFASRSISPTSPECAGSEAEGMKMRNLSTVLMTSAGFTLHTIL